MRTEWVWLAVWKIPRASPCAICAITKPASAALKIKTDADRTMTMREKTMRERSVNLARSAGRLTLPIICTAAEVAARRPTTLAPRPASSASNG